MFSEFGRKTELRNETTKEEAKKDKYLPIERGHREELKKLKELKKAALEGGEKKEKIDEINYEITETERQILLYRDARLMRLAESRRLKNNPEK